METWQWYHIVLTFYGNWLPGDPRGFRTRKHREHVEGDYKNPPPAGRYERRHRRSRGLLKHAPVLLPPAWRRVVGEAVRDRLQMEGADVLCVAAAGRHVHIQAKVPFGHARGWAGLAKLHAWHVSRDRGWTIKLWGKRGKEVPIRDRRHQVNVYWYIRGHIQVGAWFWSRIE